MAARSGQLRTRHILETGFFATPFRRVASATGLLALLALPHLLPPFWLGLLDLALIAVVGAVALNLLMGEAGLLSLGQGGFLAAGAFTAAALGRELDAPVWIVLPVAAAVGVALGVAVGTPALRLRGVYLSVSTLAAQFVVLALAHEYQSAAGGGGALVVSAPQLAGAELRGDKAWYYALLAAAAVAVIIALNLRRTHVGRAWRAIRARDLVASSLGVDVRGSKIGAFILTTTMTTVAGALSAYYSGFVATEAFGFPTTLQYLAMVTVGGLGSVLGSVLGALFITVLPYAVERALEALPVPSAFRDLLFAVQAGAFALLMLGFLLFEPRGLAGIWARLRAYAELWPFRHQPLDR